MNIKLTPMRRDDSVVVEKRGDVLIINGTQLDFTPLVDGSTIVRDAIDCEWVASDVSRINGNIEITIILPHSATASHEARFPEPIINVPDGLVDLPI